MAPAVGNITTITLCLGAARRRPKPSNPAPRPYHPLPRGFCNPPPDDSVSGFHGENSSPAGQPAVLRPEIDAMGRNPGHFPPASPDSPVRGGTWQPREICRIYPNLLEDRSLARKLAAASCRSSSARQSNAFVMRGSRVRIPSAAPSTRQPLTEPRPCRPSALLHPARNARSPDRTPALAVQFQYLIHSRGDAGGPKPLPTSFG